MKIKSEELDDMIFVANIMGLAHDISERDHERIKRLLANKDCYRCGASDCGSQHTFDPLGM